MDKGEVIYNQEKNDASLYKLFEKYVLKKKTEKVNHENN